MNLIDKIIDRLDALDKFKERVYIWYNYKDTQVALAIILFLVLIGTVLYFIFDVGLPWYWSLIFVCSLCIGILYLIVRYTRNKRKNIGTVMAVPIKTIGLDFNRMVLDNIYYVLRGYEKIDVEKTGIDNFHAVLTQQFEDTDSEIHFIAMNWGEVRYVLSKFKEKCGVEYSTFEKSNKLFLDGKLVTAKKLSNNGLRKHPAKYFTDKIDSCFPR